MTSASPQLTTVVLTVLMSDRTEVSISTAVSLMRLQNEIARLGSPIDLRVGFATDENEALNACPDDATIVLVDARISFEPDFVLGTLDPGCPPVVVGVHPLPRVDWNRVSLARTVQSREPLEQAGNVYNVTPRQTDAASGMRWLPIESMDARAFCVAFLPAAVKKMRAAAETARSRAPSIGRTAVGRYQIFARDGIIDGVYVDKHAWMLHLVDPSDVYADIAYPCGFTGIAEFAGCVGQRHVLR